MAVCMRRRDEDTIGGMLETCGHPAEYLGLLRWRLPVGGGVPAALAEVRDDWLCIEADPEGVRRAFGGTPLPDLLALNARIAGGGKLVLPHDGSGVGLRAEIPLDGADLERWVRAGCGGLAEVLRARPNGDALQEDDAPAEDSSGLDEIVREAGWESARRRDGLSAAVGEPGRTYRARISGCPGGGVRASVSLGEHEPMHPACQEAISALLLRAGGVVRMARPVMSRCRDGERLRFGFEAVLPDGAAPAEMNHALSSLSVACALCAREAEALTDQGLARLYLAAQGRC
ncbi:MAG: hypothetical protein KBC96_13050 [Armatimonadetes bacterium]|nr:hypothetical protein [Armatimonadota bacterium]